jgi:hypothetical protein
METTARATWGPFTGRQLTIIICTVVVTVLFPIGAWAVTGNNVFVTDATNGRHAAVDAKNGLVATVHDAASGKSAAVNSARQLQVGGSVIARPTFLTELFHAAGNGSGTSCHVIATPPAGRALIVTELDMDVYGGTPAANTFIPVYSNSTCSGGPEWDVTPATLGTSHITFQNGFAVNAGQSVAAKVFSGNYSFELYVHGYTVPAGSVPAAAPNAPAQPAPSPRTGPPASH